MASTRAPETIDEYIAGFPPEVQAILTKLRRTIKAAAPEAEERISYRIPAFMLDGPLVYFAAFKNHIGFYPPIHGDSAVVKAVEPFAGEKGNLRFPLDQPIPYPLITRIVKLRIRQNRETAAARKKPRSAPNRQR